MISVEDYTLRISQATPAQLVVINYELIVLFLTDALEAYGPEKAKHPENKDAFARQVNKAKNGLMQLVKGLNFEITLAQDLYQIYEYIDKRLNTAYFSFDRAAAAEALSLIEMLLAGWREAAKQETNASPAMEHAPQVYAGLTYRKEGLSEYVIQNDERGYKA